VPPRLGWSIADYQLHDALTRAAGDLEDEGVGEPGHDGGLSANARRIAARVRGELRTLLAGVVELDPNDVASGGLE
jgi:hypothetical protein